MENNKRIIKMAIAYDFDGTLAKGNIQENSFLPKLGISKQDFWDGVKENARSNDMNEILSYMQLIIKEAEKKDVLITHDELKKHGANVELFDHVENYFKEISKYATQKNVELEHYIISSGTKEMIEGTKIAKYFRAIFASSFVFDQYDKPCWPATAIDYTSKTQYLYRISKGIRNTWDSSKINKRIPEKEREICFENMIYIGDGETDIPAMALLKSKKGSSIIIYDKENSEKENQAKEILQNNKANYAVPIDYSPDGALIQLIKTLIDKIAIDAKYSKYQWEKEKSKEHSTPISYSNQYLQTLGVSAITLDKNCKNCIILEEDTWDDLGFKTLFRIYRKQSSEREYLGKIKIAFADQPQNSHTSEHMDKSFKQLDKKFFSTIKLTNQDLSQQEKEALRSLLNVIDESSEYENEEVVKQSLRRNAPFYFKTELEK